MLEKIVGEPYHRWKEFCSAVIRQSRFDYLAVVIQVYLSYLVTLSSISSAYAEAGLRQPNCVEKTLTFQELVGLRCGKGGVPSEVAAQVPFPITLSDRFQTLTPTVGAVDIAGAKGTQPRIAELVIK